MDCAQPDKPIQTLQATAANAGWLSKPRILSQASCTPTASVDDPTRNMDDVRRHSSFLNVLKSSLVELAKLEGDFNHLWIQEFRELYFNPLPLKMFSYALCLTAANVVTDLFDQQIEKGYHERLGIEEHEGERFWRLMRSIGHATSGAAGVISLILLHFLRRFSTQNYDGIVFLSLLFPSIGVCIVTSSDMRQMGASTYHATYRWDHASRSMRNLTHNTSFSEMIMANITYNVSFSASGLPTVSCRDTNAAARLLEVQ